MGQHIDLIFKFNTFKGMFTLCLLMTLTFLNLSGGKVYGDSTYFPEDMDATDEAADRTAEENSAAIREWAELPPPKKKTVVVVPPKNVEKSGVSLAESQAVTPTVKAIPSLKEPQPLQTTTVEPRSKAIPVKEQATEQTVTKKTVLSYADVANNRPPLGILEPGQEVHNQKWYIYSSAIRGLKNPSDKLQVVTMEGSPSNKGEEIKALLVDMGIEPEKIQLIHGTGEENQKGITYIFAGR